MGSRQSGIAQRRAAVGRLRGAAVAAFSGLVSIAAHTAAGGSAPDESSIVLLVAACAAFGAMLSVVRTDSDALLLVPALAGGQFLGHGVLTLSAGHAHGATATFTPAMLSAHAAATLVCAVAIGAASHTLGVRRFRRLLPTRFLPAVDTCSAIAPTTPAHRRLTHWLLVRTTGGTRAPPVLA
ncbi:hypothetical protein G4H71_06220 [Rhodococcus triatomae]|uniref:Uncharacterized protein n=1 Tax=Rhodococcus triatomae TaxID=300028 RepID=A0A1G8AWR3_9NOCA|nr:hypothetical protein [Rhodococcus triatomae]QNG17650.1 hypothetical protein G4H72_01825 [Rhodococcus triatomae]QNG22683.1 hypothetical protein G4H71_06220 [Rhodococcus triatomae]SDH25445.1 hypothetical protein SAMN05444695_101567 [Rhodococcus triatomae]